MARIPVYEQRAVIGAGDLPTARASSSVSASDPVAESLQRIGQQGMNLAGGLMQEQIKKQEDTAAVDVANVLSQADVYWQEKITEATKSWTVGGPDLRETLGKEFDAWQSDTAGKLGTDKARQYFNQHAAGMKSKMQTGVYSYQERATTAKLNADSAAGEQADENVVYNEPTRADEIYRRRMETVIARNDLTEADKIAAADKFKRKLAYSAERGQLDRDPEGWYRQRFGDFRKPVPASVSDGGNAPAGGAGGFSAAVDKVFQHEGGYAASDGNSGAPVNFGINQAANPDIDVKNLTKEAATKIYKERYWDKINGDNLPAALQGTAMDAAVNQGPALANRWIQESGGNVAKFNALRREHYERLLQDPKNQKYRKAWLGRLASYEGQSEPLTSQTVASQPVANVTPGANGAPDTVTGGTNIKQPATFTTMDWEQQAALKQHAEARMKQLESTFRAEADRAVADAVAMHKDGLVDPNELTPDFFNRAYGADGARLYKDYVASRDMGGDIGRFKTQSEADIQAEIQRDAPVAGEGYANADARRNVRVQAAQHVLQARNADPAGYVASTNESINAQRRAIDNPQTPPEQRPAMVQRYVRESLAEQTRLGVRSPRILTPGQADAIAGRAMNAQKPEDSANLIAGLEAEYGSFFPKVFGELVRDKKISGELLLIPNLPSQTAREAVSRLARVKESDLTQGMKETDMTTAKEAVSKSLAELARTTPLPTEMFTSTMNSMETSMRKLTYQYMLSGQPPKDAAKSAQAMLLGHYQFDDTLRIPKGLGVGEIRRGLKHMLKTDLGNIDVHANYVRSSTPEETRAQWIDSVQANAFWFTNDSDTGANLWTIGKDGVPLQVTRGGKPVTYSWIDITSRVATSSGRVSSGKIIDMTGGNQ